MPNKSNARQLAPSGLVGRHHAEKCQSVGYDFFFVRAQRNNFQIFVCLIVMSERREIFFSSGLKEWSKAGAYFFLLASSDMIYKVDQFNLQIFFYVFIAKSQ